MAEYYNWTKGTKLRFTPHFTSTEFECKCKRVDCVDQRISKDLITRLEKIRLTHNAPITITSGYRCEKHQEALQKTNVNAVKKSQHTLGNAADLTATDLNGLYKLLDVEFKALGIAKSFYHVDTRNDKTRRFSYV